MPAIVGVFDNGIDLEQALCDLKDAGFRHIRVVDREHELEVSPTGSWSGVDDHTPDLGILRQDMETLCRMAVPEADAFAYAECVQRGKKLLVVRTSNRHTREILEILDAANASTEPILKMM